jgi:hypothetical protein
MKRVVFLFLMIMTSTNNCANSDLLESPDQKPTLQELATLMGVPLNDPVPLTLVTAATAAPSSKPTSAEELRYKCYEREDCPFNGRSFNGFKSHLSAKHKSTKFKEWKKCTTCGRKYFYHSLHPGVCLVIDAASAESTRKSNGKRTKTVQYHAKHPGSKKAGKSNHKKKNTKR